MSNQILNLKIRGLHTNENQLSAELSDGALSIANNVVIDADNQVSSRRGFTTLTTLTSGSDRVDAITSYQDKIIVHRSNDNKMSYYSSSTWTDYSGTYSNPDSDYARMKFAQMNSNLYFTTSTGVSMLDVYSGSIYGTGMPKGLDAVASTTGASGFMANNTQVAYRVIWGARDANNNLYLGSPSQRFIASNSTGGTRDVSITLTIPSGITTSDFFQVYRSKASSSSSTEPDDELQFVYEKNPTSGEISALSLTFTDSTPDSMRGAYLYSNANQDGIQESNDIPPYAKDITPFKNFMFFAGIKTKQYVKVNLLAVSGSGLVADDTITINSMVFTAKAATTVASREFKVFTAGSASQNIDDTAKELVKVINQYLSNTTIYAYYLTGYSDLPGQIYLEQRTITGSSFTVAVSRAAAWTLDNSGTSQNNDYANGLMWSKIQQPEHVPTSHLQLIGDKSHPIRRILSLRDSLFILKTDGVWRLTGINGNWTIDPLDTSTKILAPESAVVLNNQIYCLSDQGIVAISDVGVQVLSRPIENQLTELIGLDYDKLKKLSFGISYETDRKYMLYTISDNSDSAPTQSFVYNTFTNTWTTSDKPATIGLVNSTDDKLYLAHPTSNKVLIERKDFAYTDFVDEARTDVSYSIVSYSTTSVVLNDVSGIVVGDLLTDGTLYSPITAVDPITNTVTTYDSKSWSIGAINILQGINCEVEWINQHGGNPAIDKHFQEAQVFFKQNQFSTTNISFYTDISGGYEAVPVVGQYGGGGWGLFAWGELPWGGIVRQKPIRVFIPREKSRGTLISVKFNIRIGYSKWAINGMSVFFDQISERSNRD